MSMYPQVRASFFCVLFLRSRVRAMGIKSMGRSIEDQSTVWVAPDTYLAAISHACGSDTPSDASASASRLAADWAVDVLAAVST